jgi:alpha-beta hydrolase superfamily lysophospholipase
VDKGDVTLQLNDTTWRDMDGFDMHIYQWLPDTDQPRGIVQISHGMAEHAGRYVHFAEALTDSGFAVYALDWRGHGLSCRDESQLGNLGPNGFEAMVEHTFQLRERIRGLWSELPVFLFGHSMGSFVAQRAMQRYGQAFTGVILSGTQGKQGFQLDLGTIFARREARRHGDGYVSNRLLKLTFAGYNRRYPIKRTPFDWLSRDEDVVDSYVADNRCGFGLTAGSLRDLFIGLRTIHQDTEIRSIPTDLPVLLITGTMDPVGSYGKGVRMFQNQLRRAGVADVTCHMYPGARHELLNETNRDEVINDVLTWLGQRA